jgi:hypothetical protein
MKAEGDNLRAALAWSRVADTELHLRLIGSLRMLWLAWGSYREARHWFETALKLPGATEPTRGRAAALLTAGALSAMQMENAAGRVWLEESERLWRHFGDARQGSDAQLYLAATCVLRWIWTPRSRCCSRHAADSERWASHSGRASS